MDGQETDGDDRKQSGNRFAWPVASAPQLTQWDRDHVWHSFTQMKHYEPFIVERAHGCRLVDVEGREYLDGVSSLWCNVHGHNHPMINGSIAAQLERVAHVTNLGASNSRTIELARKLVELTPEGLEHVFFCSDGANAIEVALKMAFQYWQQCEQPIPSRNRYVALGHAYHGDTIGTVSVGDVPLFHELFRPLLFEPIRFQVPAVTDFENPADAKTAVEETLAELDRLFSQRHAEIAAIVVEPLIQGAAGIRIHPPGLLKGIETVARRHDVLLIADEVAVGFGRTGRMFACEYESVNPDLMCLGKGLSGGYLPISATLASDRIYQAFLGDYSEKKTFYHGHTFAGNPLACAAALANLAIFEKEKTLEGLPPKIERIARRIDELKQDGLALNPRSLGMVAAFELPVADGLDPVMEGYQFCRRVQELGVRIRPLGNTVIIMPPLAIEIQDIDFLFDTVRKSLVERYPERDALAGGAGD